MLKPKAEVKSTANGSTISLLTSLCDPGVCLSNVPITFNWPEKLFYVCRVCIQDKSFNNFENDTMKLSDNEATPPPPLPQTVLLFGSEKLLSLSRNRPQYSILRVHNRFNGTRLFSVFGCSGCGTRKGLNSTSNSPLTPLLTELSDFRQSA